MDRLRMYILRNLSTAVRVHKPENLYADIITEAIENIDTQFQAAVHELRKNC